MQDPQGSRSSIKGNVDAASLTLLIRSDRWVRVVTSFKLSPREREIVECIVSGVDTESSIADRLRIAPRTVHQHVARLYLKIGVTNRTQLVVRLFAAYAAQPDTGGAISSLVRVPPL